MKKFIKIIIFGFIITLCLYFSFFYDKYIDSNLPLFLKLIIILTFSLIISLFTANLRYCYVLFKTKNNLLKRKILTYYSNIVILTGMLIIFYDILLFLIKDYEVEDLFLLLINTIITYISIYCIKAILSNIYLNNASREKTVENIQPKQLNILRIILLITFIFTGLSIYSLVIGNFELGLHFDLLITFLFLSFSILFIIFIFIYKKMRKAKGKQLTMQSIFYISYNAYILFSFFTSITGFIVLFSGGFIRHYGTGLSIVILGFIYSDCILLFIQSKITNMSLLSANYIIIKSRLLVSPVIYTIISYLICICTLFICLIVRL